VPGELDDDTVAGVFGYAPPVVAADTFACLLKTADESAHGLRFHHFGEAGGVDQVAEHDGQKPALCGCDRQFVAAVVFAFNGFSAFDAEFECTAVRRTAERTRNLVERVAANTAETGLLRVLSSAIRALEYLGQIAHTKRFVRPGISAISGSAALADSLPKVKTKSRLSELTSISDVVVVYMQP